MIDRHLPKLTPEAIEGYRQEDLYRVLIKAFTEREFYRKGVDGLREGCDIKEISCGFDTCVWHINTLPDRLIIKGKPLLACNISSAETRFAPYQSDVPNYPIQLIYKADNTTWILDRKSVEKWAFDKQYCEDSNNQIVFSNIWSPSLHSHTTDLFLFQPPSKIPKHAIDRIMNGGIVHHFEDDSPSRQKMYPLGNTVFEISIDDVDQCLYPLMTAIRILIV